MSHDIPNEYFVRIFSLQKLVKYFNGLIYKFKKIDRQMTVVIEYVTFKKVALNYRSVLPPHVDGWGDLGVTRC